MTPEHAFHRSRVYGFLSLAFADPDRAALRGLRQRAAGVAESLAAIGDAESLAPAAALHRTLAGLAPRKLRALHVQCFGHAISKECPPYEAEYDQANLFQKTQTLADIAGFYRAFGLETAAALNERADHASVELEFMQFLCFKEARATALGEAPERAEHSRAAQARFLELHLGGWGRGFAQRLRRIACSGPYAELAALLGAFLAAEVKRLGVREGAAGGRLNEWPDGPDAACHEGCSGPTASPSEVTRECA